MGKSRLLDCILLWIAHWTVVLGQFYQRYSIIKPDFFCIALEDRCKAKQASMGVSDGYEFGAKPDLITWVAKIFCV
jgi:hypothetical protein